MYFLIMYIEDDKKKTINIHEIVYLYLLMIQKYSINWLCRYFEYTNRSNIQKRRANVLLVEAETC